MRRPITVVMIIVSLLGAGSLALVKMRTDIFPAINEPQIYVLNNYAGMDPSQIEGIITNVYELNFQYVDGLKGIESKNIQNMVVLKLTFYPETDMAAAMSQVVSLSNRARGQMPPSVLPPFVMRFDAANVPIGYLVLDSKTRALGELADLGMYKIRPMLIAQLPGTISFSPFGSNTRAIVITVDPDRLRRTTSRPRTWWRPWGRVTWWRLPAICICRGKCPWCPTNAMVADIHDMGDIPIHAGSDVYIRDVATIADATDINYGCALVNGRKSVYIPVVKKDTASTLTVVDQIHKSMPLFRSVVPEDVSVSYEFDESPTVRAAIKSVATEGAIGAGLTGLMILLFLGDLRSVIVVLVSIPCSLTFALVALWLTGNTLNIMSLGGLALAIGILVDEAVVTIENTHAQMLHTDSVARAARRASAATATARLLAMLCILSVFIPTFILNEPVRSLFMPLTLAVGFSMIASYLLSSTLVPVLSVWLMRHKGEHAAEGGLFGKLLAVYNRIVAVVIRLRWIAVPGYLAACGLLFWLVGSAGGKGAVSAGRCRPVRDPLPRAAGFRVRTHAETRGQDAGGHRPGGAAQGGDLDGLRRHGGHQHRHEQHAALHARPGRRADARAAPGRIGRAPGRPARPPPQGAARAVDPLDPGRSCSGTGYSAEEAQSLAEKISFGFEPGDIVSEVMSFGSPTPVEVMVVGPDLAAVRKHALQVLGEMKKISGLRDVQLYQQLDYPTVHVDIDRQKAGLSGVTGQGRYRCAVGGHLFQPLRGQELLARPAHRGRLPGAGPGAHSAHGPARNRWKHCPCKGSASESNLMVRDVAKRADRPGARRDRPQLHAALPEHHGQRRGRGPGPGVGANRQGHRCRRRTAPRGAGHRTRPGRAHDGDVPVRWPSAWSSRSS